MLRTHKLALKGIAQVTRIDIPTAVRSIRHNPLLENEIHIDEELINLKETLDTYHAAGDTLKEYPTIQTHILQERRTIMQHCIGLVVRMLYNQKLPYSYSKEDIDHAVRRLVRLVMLDSRRTGQRLDRDVLSVFEPFMPMHYRLQMKMRSNRA